MYKRIKITNVKTGGRRLKMNCKNCGKLVEGNDKFCPYCGAKMIETEEEKKTEVQQETKGEEKMEEKIEEKNAVETEEKTGKKPHLLRNVAIAAVALCAIGYAVSGSKNKSNLSPQKTEIIEKLKENAPLQSTYFELWDGTTYSFVNDDKWEIRYADETISVRIPEKEIQECLSNRFGTDELGNDGTFAYILGKNKINIYLDTEISEGTLTFIGYDVGEDEYTLTIDGEDYYASDDLKEYLDQYGLYETLLDDVEKFREDLSSMDLKFQDILLLDATDIAKYLEKDK